MAKIKICGLMRDCDVDYVNEAFPDYIGFIFAHTRREISAEDARRFRKNLREGIQAVGVFVDEELERVAWLLGEGVIDVAQLHGSEDAAYVERLKRKTGCVVVKALHPEKMGQQDKVACQGKAACQDKVECQDEVACQGKMPYQDKIGKQQRNHDICREYRKAGVDYFLFDSGSRTQAGGTGKVFDWGLIPEGGQPFFLAGGLHAGNIEEAIRAASPYAVDISSGVETDGWKDRDKILEIVRRVRNV